MEEGEVGLNINAGLLQRKRIRLVSTMLVVLLGFLSAVFASGSLPYAYAASEATAYTTSANNTITLAQDQVEFSIPLTIEYPGAFAGAELAIQTATGVDITQVNYSTDQSKAGPTAARGLVWFSTFSGKDSFKGQLTATVSASYQGSENTQIVIDHVSFYTVDGAAFSTLNVPLRTTVTILREGANNTPGTLDPPVNDITTIPGAGNPGAGSLVSYSPIGGTGTVASVTDDYDMDGTARTLGSSNNTAKLSDSATPLTENPIAGNDATPPNTALLIFAIACLVAAIAMWCLLIKKRKDKEEDTGNEEVI